MADRDLKLNSLSRYSKQSPRFILEEYGHCEVPAGCGGVVLRWRDPADGLPLPIHFYSRGEWRAYLDGTPLTEGRPTVPFGDHVLAFEISGFPPGGAVLAFSAIYDEAEPETGTRRSRLTGNNARVQSAADGTWRYSIEPPPPGWTDVSFDDTTWPALVEQERDEDRSSGYNWALARVTGAGGALLGVDQPLERVWVRKRFALQDAEAEAERG